MLSHPEIPLHTNAAEQGARQRVRTRDVSLAARTHEGVVGWDIFHALVEAAKKLGVTSTADIRDRVTTRYALPGLASLIARQSEQTILPCAA